MHRQFEGLKRNSKTLRYMSRISVLKDMNKYTINRKWKFDPCKPYLCQPPLWKLPHYCPSHSESLEPHVHMLTGTQSKFCDILNFATLWEDIFIWGLGFWMLDTRLYSVSASKGQGWGIDYASGSVLQVTGEKIE